MAYNITLTNGQNLVTIQDGTADTSYTSLTLFGKNYAGYGPIQDQNFVGLLENFSNVSAPPNGLQGQLWWDSNNKALKVKKGSTWKVVSGPTASPTAPSTDVVGDLWWDTANQQLNSYNGSNWSIIGPLFTAGQGVSGPVTTSIPDAANQPHTVVELYVAGQPMAIISKDPTFAVSSVPGYTVIKPGFNLPTAYGSYYGNSENALSLGGVLAANYLRSDVASTSHFPITLNNNSGLTLGLNNDFTINVANNAVNLISNVTGRDLDTYVNVGGVSTLAMRVDATTGLVSVLGDPTTTTGVVTKHYADTAVSTSAALMLHADGSNPLVGNIAPSINGVYSLGSAVNKLGTVYTTAVASTTVTASTGTFDSIRINTYPSTNLSAATKQYVDDVAATVTGTATALNSSTITQIVGAAPSDMNTLEKISNALSNNPNFNINLVDTLATLAAINSPSFTGSPTAPTLVGSDISSKLATTAFVHSAVLASTQNSALTYAPLASPALTGTPTAPTPLSTDSSTKIATTAYVANKVSQATAGLSTDNPVFTGIATFDSLSVASGNVMLGASGVTTSTNNLLDIGTASNRFRNIYGTAVSANYADLAENYVADAAYEPGTVLEFGGDAEVTLCDYNATSSVAGVVSTQPAYLMNAACEGTHIVALALQGRCPVKVTGTIKKGDLLVSAGNGRAKASAMPMAGTIIGKALANFSGVDGTIEVSISRC